MKTTIHTLKNEYKDNQTYLNEKQKLFQNLTYHMIEKDIKKFLIFIINVLIQMKQLLILMKNMINN